MAPESRCDFRVTWGGMLRRLFTLASAVSLVLFVATVVLWARSRASGIALPLRYDNQEWEVSSCQGKLTLNNTPQIRLEEAHWSRALHDVERLRRAYQASFLSGDRMYGSAVDAEHATDTRDALRVAQQRVDQLAGAGITPPASHSVSHRVPLLVTIPLPLCRLWSAARLRRRRLTGHCLHCGYDLRVTPGRCPECGTAATKNPEPTS
jgi:hypothetical protein